MLCGWKRSRLLTVALSNYTAAGRSVNKLAARSIYLEFLRIRVGEKFIIRRKFFFVTCFMWKLFEIKTSVYSRFVTMDTSVHVQVWAKIHRCWLTTPSYFTLITTLFRKLTKAAHMPGESMLFLWFDNWLSLLVEIRRFVYTSESAIACSLPTRWHFVNLFLLVFLSLVFSKFLTSLLEITYLVYFKAVVAWFTWKACGVHNLDR